MKKESQLEDVLLVKASKLPIASDGPVVYHDGDETKTVGINLENDEVALSLWLIGSFEPLALLLTNQRVICGWVSDTPLIACAFPDEEEIRYFSPLIQYEWQVVGDELESWLDQVVLDTKKLWLESQGLLIQEHTAELELNPLPLPRLSDEYLPPEDDRNSKGF